MTTGPGGAGDPMALLAEQLTELQGQLGQLADRVDGQQETLDEAARLGERVTSLSEAITRSAGTSPQDARTAVHPRIWAVMTDDESADALRDLARWVTTILLVSYPHVAAQLPPCWPGHEAVVEELDWLYWTWTDWAASPQEARSRDAADWHDRWLPGVMARIRPLLASCNGSTTHVKPEYRRTEHEDYECPPGTSPKKHQPELLFIENMGRADRAEREELRRLGG